MNMQENHPPVDGRLLHTPVSTYVRPREHLGVKRHVVCEGLHENLGSIEMKFNDVRNPVIHIMKYINHL